MNKVIVVTGASRGIGRNIAYNLAVNGHTVIANYNNSERARKLVDYTIEKYGRIDVLINNAGIAESKLIIDITDEDFDKMIKNNLYSAFYMSREASRYMIRDHKGCIINISSIYGISGGSCEVHYSISKAGIDGLTKSLAKELGPSNIRVNSIAPGAIDTDMNKNVSEEDWQALIEETPLMRKGNPIDITRCVKWLIEDEFTTGQIISPNGGIVI